MHPCSFDRRLRQQPGKWHRSFPEKAVDPKGWQHSYIFAVDSVPPGLRLWRKERAKVTTDSGNYFCGALHILDRMTDDDTDR